MKKAKENLFDGILLLSDLDGTLLNSKKDIPSRNINAIHRFIERGGRFSLATGRCTQSARPYIQASSANCPAVVMNGAVVYDFQEECTARQWILPDGYQEMIRKVHERFPDIGAQVYAGPDVIVVISNEIIRKQLEREHLTFKKAGLDSLPEKANKMLFGGTNEQLKALRTYLNECDIKGMYGLFSETCYYEILPSHTNKGTGAKAVADFCGIDPQNVVAVGDYYNDEDMLKSVAYPMAAGNAPEDIKKYARFVTGDCERGVVADAIEHLENILIQKGSLL